MCASANHFLPLYVLELNLRHEHKFPTMSVESLLINTVLGCISVMPLTGHLSQKAWFRKNSQTTITEKRHGAVCVVYRHSFVSIRCGAATSFRTASVMPVLSVEHFPAFFLS